jgi:hypothetical protein
MVITITPDSTLALVQPPAIKSLTRLAVNVFELVNAVNTRETGIVTIALTLHQLWFNLCC